MEIPNLVNLKMVLWAVMDSRNPRRIIAYDPFNDRWYQANNVKKEFDKRKPKPQIGPGFYGSWDLDFGRLPSRWTYPYTGCFLDIDGILHNN